MRRLLWEEWHEIRWYFLWLLIGPWAWVMFSFGDLGYDPQFSSSTPWDIFPFVIVLSLWGATRMSAEFRADRFSLRRLPISSWKVWAAKFLPGLIASMLLPLWIHLAVSTTVHPLQFRPNDSPLAHILTNLAVSVSGYAVAFTLSMLISSIAGILIAWFMIFAAQTLLWFLDSLIAAFFFDNVFTMMLACLSVAALLANVLIWFLARNRGAPWRWVAALLPLPISLLLVGLLWMIGRSLLSQVTGGLPIPWGVGADAGADVFKSPVTAGHVPGTDRDAVAYRVEEYFGEDQVRVRDRRADRLVFQGGYAAPLAWLPDGDLLIRAADSKHEMRLLRWNNRENKTTALAAFPASAEQRSLPPIAAALPDSTGSRAALFVAPRRGSGLDLWMLDLRTGKLELLKPGIGNLPFSLDIEAAWQGDRIVFERGQTEFWSIRADGSELRPVTDSDCKGGE